MVYRMLDLIPHYCDLNFFHRGILSIIMERECSWRVLVCKRELFNTWMEILKWDFKHYLVVFSGCLTVEDIPSHHWSLHRKAESYSKRDRRSSGHFLHQISGGMKMSCSRRQCPDRSGLKDASYYNLGLIMSKLYLIQVCRMLMELIRRTQIFSAVHITSLYGLKPIQITRSTWLYGVRITRPPVYQGE